MPEPLPMVTTTALTVEEFMQRGLTREEAQHRVNELVVGVGYKTDRHGRPIEQGLGHEPETHFIALQKAEGKAVADAARARAANRKAKAR
jgi:hypothetical protein